MSEGGDIGRGSGLGGVGAVVLQGTARADLALWLGPGIQLGSKRESGAVRPTGRAGTVTSAGGDDGGRNMKNDGASGLSFTKV